MVDELETRAPFLAGAYVKQWLDSGAVVCWKGLGGWTVVVETMVPTSLSARAGIR